MANERSTDFAMTILLIFLLIYGDGRVGSKNLFHLQRTENERIDKTVLRIKSTPISFLIAPISMALLLFNN